MTPRLGRVQVFEGYVQFMENAHLNLVYSGMARRALHLAEKAHRGTTRKAGDQPYVLHPIVVAQVLAAARADTDLICAAYLHDVPEDTELTLRDIEDEFGARVARLVGGVTKASHDEHGDKYTSDQKAATTEQAMTIAEIDICALKAADLIANLSDLIFDQKNLGFAHWDEIFGAKAPKKIAHYIRLGDILLERLTDEHAYPLLAATLRERLNQFKDKVDEWGKA